MENSKSMSSREIVLLGLMIALVYISGSIIKVPTFGGFIHIGDCMVFLSVVVLGKKRGALASSIGMVLVDLLGGYYFWAPFTFIIKGLMAYIAGSILEKLEKSSSFKYIISFVISGIFMVIAYFFAGIIVAGFLTDKIGLMAGVVYAAKDIVGNIIQVTTGIVIALPLTAAVLKTKSQILANN